MRNPNYKKYRNIILVVLLLLSLVGTAVAQIDLREGTTTSGETQVTLIEGNVTFAEVSSGAAISVSTTIDGEGFKPAITKTDGADLTWGTGEKTWFIFDDPTVKFTYNYNGNVLKETIVLKEDKELRFPLKISDNSVLIPWNTGEWKVVSSTAEDTSRGIVISKPFGTDANGNYVDMEYQHVGEELVLVYDRVARVYNQTLTDQLNQTDIDSLGDSIIVKQYDLVPISYPLTIDPTYHYDQSWIQVAAQLNSQSSIRSITTFDGGTGNAIYGGTSPNGLLFKYNRTLDGWSQVAAQLNSQYIYSLVTYDDGTGNAIYGGTGSGGHLFKYNLTNSSWSQVAAQLRSQSYIYSLVAYDDGTGNAIYGGTAPNGLLFKYNSTLGNWSQVAAQLNSQTYIYSLTTYDDGTGKAIYGGTWGGGRLFKYNSTLGGWSQVAAQLGSETGIVSLTTYDDGTGSAIYGGTNTNGLLFKYNKTLGNWSKVTDQHNSQTQIWALTTYDDGTGNAIYGGTYGTAPNGLLFKYNLTNSSWSQVAAQLNSQTYIFSLTTYNDGSGNAIYGGTYGGGRLFKYNTYTIPTTPTANFFADVTSGAVPLSVSFTDTSTASPTGWAWFFGDEGFTESWTQACATAPWTAREIGQNSLVLSDGSIMILGGLGPAYRADVWGSRNGGTTWTQINPSAGWTARYASTSLLMPDRSIVIFGGKSSTSYLNDVWRSTNEGLTWTQSTASAEWSGRYLFSSVVLSDGSIVLMGGSNATIYNNDTWRSTDKGVTWTRVNASGGWAARNDFNSKVMPDNSIILMGGYTGSTRLNDVWRSTDSGTTWTRVNASAGWSARSGSGVVVMPDSSLVLMGGYNGTSYLNGVWRSTDGGNIWTQLTSAAAWSARQRQGTVVLPNGTIVLMGGYTGAWSNEVWQFSPIGSSSQNPSHTYNTAGTYSVSLQAYDMNGYNNTRKIDYITVTSGAVAPVASFTANVTSGNPPLPVLFTDSSTNTPTSWNWSFKNVTGNNTEVWWTTAQNPVLTFGVGNFSIKLNATNSAGSNISAQSTFINVSTAVVAPVASFTANITTGTAPLPVLFTDTSTNTPTSWNWSFKNVTGNNTEIWWTTAQSPTLTFGVGNFSIKLNATNSAGSNISTQSTFINVSGVVTPALIVNFVGDPLSGEAPLEVDFTDLTTGSPTGWAWFFGDENYTQPWTRVNASAGWSARWGQTSVVLPDSSIILMGGTAGVVDKNDVWRSTDSGLTWTQINSSAGWTGRNSLTSVVLADGSILIMGGNDDGTGMNDVWRSSDKGLIWTRVNASAGWVGRYAHTSVVLPDGSVVIMGGSDTDYNYLNDTWRSTNNGVTWTRMTAGAPWTGRDGLQSIAMSDGGIILMGGFDIDDRKNDVWKSTNNGATWTQVNASAEWIIRNGHNSVVMPDNSLLLLGGVTWDGYKNDTWRSTDGGKIWSVVNSSSGWAARYFHTSVVMPNGSIVLMGGYSGIDKNDVWLFNPIGSSLQNPTHTYTTAGTYNVSLQAYDSTRYNSTSKVGYITVTGPPAPLAPVASFTANITTGTAPLPVLFTDTSTNTPTSWNWSFKNVTGNNTETWWTTAQSPVLTFGVGNFSIKLNATNSAGSNISAQSTFINVSAAAPGVIAPVASFTANITTGTSPLPVLFTDTSTNTPTGWNWSFKDVTGNNTEIWWSTSQSPIKTFNSGNFSIKLNATNSAGSNISAQSTFINVSEEGPAPGGLVADFVGDPLSSLLPPLEVTFTDLSTGGPTNWIWFFGDEAFETEMTSSAEWGTRYNQRSVSLPDGSIVLLGGWDGSSDLNDVWKSTNNGTTWTQINSSAGWPVRESFTSVVMADGSILVMGGYSEGNPLNDVWRSIDGGETWTEVNASAGWTPRFYHSSVAMADGSVVLMGGFDDSFATRNDVWRSTDSGTTWTQVNASAGWSARYSFSSVSLPDGSIVLMGGDDGSTTIWNDVWRSTDSGTTWSEVTPAADWAARYSHTSVVLPDGSIVLTSGSDSSYVYLNDVWRSTDGGITWTEMNPSARWSPRDGHSSVAALDGSVLLMGGSDGGYFGDVWRFMVPGSLEQNPVHTYTDPGNYTVSLQIYNATGGYDDISKVDYVEVGGVPLIVNFTGSPLSGLSPLEVNFTDLTTSSPLTWNWTFGDIGGSNTSTLQNPTHTYNTAGVFTVNLTVTNSWGRHSEVKTAYVTVFESGVWNKMVVDNTSSESVKYNDIAVDSEDRPRIAYQYLDDNVWDYYLKYASFNGGSWTKNIISEDANTGHGASLVIDQATDIPHISHEIAGEPYTLYYTFYNGTDWNPEIVAYHTYYSPSSNSIQYNGSPIIAYADASDPPGLVYGMKSGGSWSTDTIEAPTTYGTGFNPSFVIEPGITGVAYSRSEDVSWTGSLLYAEEGTGWATEIISLPGVGYTWYRPSLDYDSSLEPHIAFYNSSGLFYASRSGGVWDIETVSSSLYVSGVSLVIDSGDKPHVVYGIREWEGVDNGLYYATKDPGGTSWTTELVDAGSAQAPVPGDYLAITSDNVGALHVSYEWRTAAGEITETVLKYAYKNEGALNAAFSANLTSGTAPLAVKFTDLSTGGTIDSWNWSFGDNTYSELENPEHTYGVGLYTVILNVTLGSSFDIETKVDYINVTGVLEPVANFTSNVTSGTAPLAVQFTDTTTNIPTSWNWSFNNVTGNNTETWWSTAQNPTLTLGIGNFSIKLNATNSAGYNITPEPYFINVSLLVLPPVSSFTSNVTSGTAPVAVQFTDTSANLPTAWNWSFKNIAGNNTEVWWSVIQNATITLTEVGNYSIKLRTENSAGFNITPGAYFINVTGVVYTPVANFTGSPLTGGVPLTVMFTDTSTNTPTSWLWNFGDMGAGNTSTLKNPSHIYSSIGDYTVNLTATNSAGSDSEVKTNYVNATASSIASKVLIAGTYGNYARIYRSLDAGLTWSQTAILSVTPSPITTYGTTSLVSLGNGTLLAGTYSAQIYKSTDAGETWTFKTNMPNNSAIWSLTNLGGGVVVAGGANGQRGGDIYKSTDYGETWSFTGVELGDSTSTRVFSLANLGDGTTVLAGNYPYGTIYNSTDAGSTWQTVQALGTSNSVRALLDLGSGTLLAGTSSNGEVYQSQNSGLNWSLSQRLGTESFIMSLTNCGGTVLAGASPYGGIYTSPDLGTSWNFTERLGPEDTVYSLAYIGDGKVVAGTGSNGTIYRSTNSGLNWTYIKRLDSFETTTYALLSFDSYPIANFTNSSWTPRTGIVPYLFQFNDTTRVGPTSWLWNFGDMSATNTSTVQNATHWYNTTGTFTVTLTASNDFGNNTSTKVGYVTIGSATTADFIGTPLTGAAPLSVQFNDTSTGTPLTTWLWDFGDMVAGNTSTVQNATHIYLTPGVYTVNMTGSNFWGSFSKVRTGYVTATTMSVDFIGVPTSGWPPLSVQFNDTSPSSPTSWNWSFGEGNFSTAQNTTHWYNNTGRYTVGLSINTTDASGNLTRNNYIYVYIPLKPVVDFTGVPRYGGIPLSVQFNVSPAVNTTAETLWNWSFGDGGVNETKNATHIYTTVGLYTVNLTATNIGGGNSTVKVGYIDVRPAYSGNEIYGWVRNGTSTEVIPGSLVYLTTLGGVSVTNITDSFGAYSFSGLPTMTPYALHATKSGWTPAADVWVNSGLLPGMTTRQNLSMTIGGGGGGTLYLDLTFRDLTDGSLITQSVGADVTGGTTATYYTTTGFYNITNLTQDSAIYVRATSSGYQPGSTRTYAMNTSMNDTIYLSKESTSAVSHVYYPHQVRFTTEDPYGTPLGGVHVNVRGYNTTYANSSWWNNIFGLDMSETNLFETMGGVTASDGSIVFLMSESIYYAVDLSIGPYTQNLTVYPKEDSYLVIMTPGGSLFSVANSTSNVFYDLNAIEINSTYVALNLNYTDQSHATTSVTFWVDNQTRATRIWDQTYSGDVNATYYLDITTMHGQSIYYGFFAHHIDAGNVSLMKTLTIKSRLVEIGLDDITYQWVSIILLVMFTALFSGITVRYGYVLVPFMGAFLWYIGWFQTTNVIVVSAVILGILLYTTKTQAISEG